MHNFKPFRTDRLNTVHTFCMLRKTFAARGDWRNLKVPEVRRIGLMTFVLI